MKYFTYPQPCLIGDKGCKWIDLCAFVEKVFCEIS